MIVVRSPSGFGYVEIWCCDFVPVLVILDFIVKLVRREVVIPVVELFLESNALVESVLALVVSVSNVS